MLNIHGFSTGEVESTNHVSVMIKVSVLLSSVTVGKLFFFLLFACFKGI